MTHYHGERTIDGIAVTADGVPLPTQTVLQKHSDRGFEWSYEGPEPAQLAFALLYDHLHDAAAAGELQQRFMQEIVANFDNDWDLASTDLEETIAVLRRGATG